MEKLYRLLKTYKSPTVKIHKDVTKTENEWKKMFSDLETGNYEIKNDWFDYIGVKINNENSFKLSEIYYHRDSFISFAKYAKNYCTPKKVEDAFDNWLIEIFNKSTQ